MNHQKPRVIKNCLILFALILLFVNSPGCSSPNEPYTRVELVLGTVCSITLYGSEGKKALDDCFWELERLEDLMSAHLDDSQVARVNRNSGLEPVAVSGDIIQVIKTGILYGELSGGLFDITSGPLVDLWGIGSDYARIPDESEISGILKLLNYQSIRVDEASSSVYLPEKGMALDLGAIAKGFASDRISQMLKERGIERGLLNLGGNVHLVGRKSPEAPWRAAVQNPFSNRGEWIGYLDLEDKALVTSGKYERFLEVDGIRYHHILHPDTGYPVENGVASVTICHPSGMAADSLSTAVFLLGLKEGMALLESLPEAEGIVVMENNDVYLTSGITDFVITDSVFSLAELSERPEQPEK